MPHAFRCRDGSIWRSNQELGRILGKLREVQALNIDTRDLISVTEASNRGVSRLIQDAAQGRTQVVLRNNKAVAAVVGIEAVERLGRLEELEDDLRLLSVALARTVTDSGRRYSLDEVAAELGVDLDSLVDED
jgi:antitoxin (DNA-binding transcriptional repressor) of toxin-antitoxin stability system